MAHADHMSTTQHALQTKTDAMVHRALDIGLAASLDDAARLRVGLDAAITIRRWAELEANEVHVPRSDVVVIN